MRARTRAVGGEGGGWMGLASAHAAAASRPALGGYHAAAHRPRALKYRWRAFATKEIGTLRYLFVHTVSEKLAPFSFMRDCVAHRPRQRHPTHRTRAATPCYYY